MRIDAIPVGHDPPEDVNVIIEVPIGGEPIKYEMDKAAGTLVVDVVDAARRQMVWEGLALGRVTQTSAQDLAPVLDRVVAEMFQEFPLPAR